jgi:hypothetical protein
MKVLLMKQTLQYILSEVKLDKDMAWIWNYADKDINTAEIFEIYLKENDSNN